MSPRQGASHLMCSRDFTFGQVVLMVCAMIDFRASSEDYNIWEHR
jgi:hypothetical protein